MFVRSLAACGAVKSQSHGINKVGKGLRGHRGQPVPTSRLVCGFVALRASAAAGETTPSKCR